jgi:hypothetical protein
VRDERRARVVAAGKAQREPRLGAHALVERAVHRQLRGIIAELDDVHAAGLGAALHLDAVFSDGRAIEEERRMAQLAAVEVDFAGALGTHLYVQAAHAHSPQLIVCLCQRSDHDRWMGDFAGREIGHEAPAAHGLLDRVVALVVVQRGPHERETRVQQGAGGGRLAVQCLQAALGELDDLPHAALRRDGASECDVLDGDVRLLGERVDVREGRSLRLTRARGEAVARVVKRDQRGTLCAQRGVRLLGQVEGGSFRVTHEIGHHDRLAERLGACSADSARPARDGQGERREGSDRTDGHAGVSGSWARCCVEKC